MNTCRNCKFWELEEHSWREQTRWAGTGICNAIVMLSDDSPIPEESRLAYVQDASEYSATLYCLPDFGCVEFQPRSE